MNVLDNLLTQAELSNDRAHNLANILEQLAPQMNRIAAASARKTVDEVRVQVQRTAHAIKQAREAMKNERQP